MTAPKTIPMIDIQAELDELWDELHAAVTRVLRSGQFVFGPDVTAFEDEVATSLEVKHAISVNSGTDALVIGLRALGIGPGDEVVTTAFSFFATAEAVSSVGATPVFVDINETTLNLDPNQLEDAVTEHTKAILPVHLFGLPAAMGAVMDVAERHGLVVLEDCAQAFGARYQGSCHECPGTCAAKQIEGKRVGSIGQVGAFLFYPTKNLGAYGDGGLMTTNDDEIADAARRLRNHGSSRTYQHTELGYNSRLDSLQAAILRVKLPHVERWNRCRAERARVYHDGLADLPGVVLPLPQPSHVWHQYTLRLTGHDRDTVQQALQSAGVASKVYYPTPLHRLPLYETSAPLPVSERAAQQVLSLPMSAQLSLRDLQFVVDAIRTTIT